MDTTIIEHLACLEINKCILQPPFHLLSNVQWNDKGISFDGDISVFNKEIKKTDFIGLVPIQIKGTTTHKRITKKNKIRFSVQKEDLDVYYKNGKGVLYFVVTINHKTYSRQAYYRILAPLDLKDLLYRLEKSGNQSITIPFKKLEDGSLEGVCKTFLKLIEKQPIKYIETSTKTEFTEYKIDYLHLQTDSIFDFFDEQAYVYGVIEDLEIPINTVEIFEIRQEANDAVELDGELINVQYEIRVCQEKINIFIENSLTFDFDKSEINGKVALINGKLTLGKLKTIGSYLKCLKIINYMLKNNRMPLPSLRVVTKLVKKDIFLNIEEDIKIHEDLLNTCRDIGINDDYIFNEHENLSDLFNGIIRVFKNKQYDLINIDSNKLESGMICNIWLSEYLWVILIYKGNKFIDFFSKEALSTIGGFIPKNDQTKVIEENKWEQKFWKVSIYASQSISKMNEAAKF
jgi:hypothetical protein